MGFETLGRRSLVTLIFGPFILFCAWKGGYIFLALISSIVILGMNEFYDLATQKVTIPQRVVGIAAGVAACFLMFYNRVADIWILFTLVVVVVLVIELFRNEVAPILNVSTTLMGLAYVGYLLSFLILIREQPLRLSLEYGLGGRIVMVIFLCIWLCDTSAYLLGSRLGRHKLFERVSPNKTVEGTMTGLTIAILTALVCQMTFVQGIALHEALILGAICGSVGQVSDLLESLFKRDARVKDSSNLIPGHGGVLDRFDSEVLVAPVAYLYLQYLVF